MTAVLCLFTVSNSDCLFYSTSVLNCFCKRNFFHMKSNFFYHKSRKKFLKTNSMQCSAEKTGSFSYKDSSIDYQSQTPKSKKLGNHFPVGPSYCTQLRWSDHYGTSLSPQAPHILDTAPYWESAEASSSFAWLTKVFRKLFKKERSFPIFC